MQLYCMYYINLLQFLLYCFFFGSNQICYIEEKETKLKNLEELSLSKNSIKELPVIFLAGMTSLRILDVSRNCLGKEGQEKGGQKGKREGCINWYCVFM